MTTTAELEQLGLVAPKEEFTELSPARFEAEHLRQWPDYQYNLDRARPNKTGDGLDLSGVDCFVACFFGKGMNLTSSVVLSRQTGHGA